MGADLPKTMNQLLHYITNIPNAVCVCVCVLGLDTKCIQNTHSTTKGTIFLGCVDILSGSHHLKGVFEGQDMFLRLRLELGFA